MPTISLLPHRAYFLVLALTSLLYGIGVVPLGARGWSMLSVALAVGGPFLLYVPEWLFGQYRVSRSTRG